MRRATGRELGTVLADLTAAIGYPAEIRFGMAPEEATGLAVLEDAPSDVDLTQLPTTYRCSATRR